MRKIAKTGRTGEDIAADFLRSKGYIISKRNFHSRYGEIDIIAENEQYILFVEVKTRKEGSLVAPCEAVGLAKQRKLASTAALYICKSFCELQPRFDVAEIIVKENKKGEEYEIKYIENAFIPEAL